MEIHRLMHPIKNLNYASEKNLPGRYYVPVRRDSLIAG
jgi:hypothetical protein